MRYPTDLSPRRMVLIAVAICLLLGLSAVLIGVPRSIEFTGGTMIRIRSGNDLDASAVESALEGILRKDVSVDLVRGGLDARVQAQLTEDQKSEIRGALSAFGVDEGEVSIDSLGQNIIAVYAGQAVFAVVGAFIAMAVIIMIAFRRRIPVAAMLLAVGLDMLCVFGLMSIFRVDLSLASMAGILMLIGYSVDTNILLTTSLLRRTEGEPLDRLRSAVRTGLMMSGTTLIPLVALNLLTTAPQLYQLTMVLIFGILADMMNTWLLNSGLLLWHIGRKKEVRYHVAL
ncbi:MAG: hypothetical protein QW567_01905 [Candidatus Hadarchaeales archaeon]